MFRLRKVRVMLALRGFTRRSFNDFYHSPLMAPEYIWGYSYARASIFVPDERLEPILGDTYGQDNITVLTEDLSMRMKMHRLSHGRKLFAKA